MRSRLSLVFVLPVSLLVGCASASPGDEAEESSSASVTDIASMRDDGAGTYTVTCRDGHVEQAVTAERIRTDHVCTPSSIDDRAFDPATCVGDALTADRALALGQFDVVAGKTTRTLGRAQHAMRIRDCNTSGACGSWRKPGAAPALVVTGTRQVLVGDACPFAQRAPVLCGPRSSRTETLYSAIPLAAGALGGLLDAEVRLELAQNKPWLRLAGSVVTTRGTYAWAPTLTFEGKLVLFNGAEPTYKWATLAADADEAARARQPALALAGKVTSTCARWTANQKQLLSDNAGNTFTRESELAVLAQY